MKTYAKELWDYPQIMSTTEANREATIAFYE